MDSTEKKKKKVSDLQSNIIQTEKKVKELEIELKNALSLRTEMGQKESETLKKELKLEIEFSIDPKISLDLRVEMGAATPEEKPKQPMKVDDIDHKTWEMALKQLKVILEHVSNKGKPDDTVLSEIRIIEGCCEECCSKLMFKRKRRDTPLKCTSAGARIV